MKSPRATVAIGCVTVGLVSVVGLGYLFFRYSRVAEVGGQGASAIQVAILDPEPGSEWPAGSPILVQAVVGSLAPVAEVELWANGAKVALSGAASEIGQRGFFEELLWVPATAGDYVLVARAIDGEGHGSDSPAVPITVGPPLSGEGAEIADEEKLTPVQAGGTGDGPSLEELAELSSEANSAQPPPDDGESEPAQPWEPSAGGFASWLLQGVIGPPGSPHLKAEVDGCSVRLELYDAMTNELGFILKRLSPPGENTFQTLAVLAPHSGKGWISYEDGSPHPGLNLYEFLAFDDEGSSASNQVAIQADDVVCALETVEEPVLTLGLRDAGPEPTADELYCYYSVGGARWARWPTDGFMLPEEFASSIQVLRGMGQTPLSLDLECWGWKAGGLALVGTLHHVATAAFQNVSVPFPEGGLALEINSAIPLTTGLLPVIPELPVHVRIPAVYADVSYDPNVCKGHLPPGAQNLLGQVLFCTPFPAYEVGEQPYLVWWANESECLAGSLCLSVQQLTARAQEEGGQVGFHVYRRDASSEPVESTPIDLSLYVVPPTSPHFDEDGFICQRTDDYRVRLYHEAGDGDVDEGPSSPDVSVARKCRPPGQVTLEVRFTEIFFGDVNDGDLDEIDILYEDELEVHGSFYAFAPDGSGGYLTLHHLCTPYFYRICVGTGSYAISWPLCPSTTWNGCGELPSWADDFHDRTIEVQVRDGQAVKVGVALLDADTNSGDDEVCVMELWTDPYSSEQWAAMEEGKFWMYHTDNGSASCKVWWRITAIDIQP